MLDAASIINMKCKEKDSEKEILRLGFRQSNGFNGDNITYVPTELSEEVIERIKETECSYCYELGFHTPFPVEGLDMKPIRFFDVAEYDEKYKRWRLPFAKCRAAIGNVCRETLSESEKRGGFVGEEGERIEVIVKLTGGMIVPSRSDFGDFCRLTFEGRDGAQYSWFQRTYSEGTVASFIKRHGNKGEICLIGTLKKHETFRGVKYNQLRNCEIRGNNGVSLAMFFKRIVKMDNGDAE